MEVAASAIAIYNQLEEGISGLRRLYRNLNSQNKKCGS
jgi:hypothetical protein